MVYDVGTEPDAGPPSSRVGGGGEEHQGVVHQSAEDQSDLPHAEHVQPRCDAEVPHQWVLVPRERPGEDSDGSAPRNGRQPQFYYAVITIAIRLRYDYDTTTTYRARPLAILRKQKNEHVNFSS